MADNVFAQLVRYHRARAGKSLNDVAKELGVSAQYVLDVERGARAPFAHERLPRLAVTLDVPIGRVLDAAAEVDGFWRLPVCQTPTHDRVASFLAVTWKHIPEEQMREIEEIFACKCAGCSSEPPGPCYSESRTPAEGTSSP